MKKILMATATVGASPDLTKNIARNFLRSAVLASSDNFTEVGVEGIVVAAPGALHAVKAVNALERGMGLFCRKQPSHAGLETPPIAEPARRRDVSVYVPCEAGTLRNPVIDSVIKLPKESTLVV